MSALSLTCTATYTLNSETVKLSNFYIQHSHDLIIYHSNYSYKRVQKGLHMIMSTIIGPTGTAEIASQYMNHHNYIHTSKVLKSVGRHLVTRPSNLFLTPLFPRWSSLSRTPSHRMTIVSISPHITLPSLTHNDSSGAPI